MTAETDKKSFRRRVLSDRRAYPAERIRECSRLIAERVLGSEEYKKADTLLCFVPTEIEVDTRPIIDRAFADGKKVAVPRCFSGRPEMAFYLISGYDDLEAGAYGILEPKESCPECTEHSDALCITPALCCGRDGGRMGFGRGYYDRFLAKFGGTVCAVVFGDFLFESVPTEPTDVPMDMIVTEKDTIYNLQK